jgi:hypothetical protein
MDKKTFELEKELLNERFKHDKNIHDLKMIELGFIRETEKLKHQWQLEAQRIKSAEIRKTIERREYREFGAKQ